MATEATIHDSGFSCEQLLETAKQCCVALHSTKGKYLGMAYYGEDFGQHLVTAGHLVAKDPSANPWSDVFVKLRTVGSDKAKRGLVYLNGYPEGTNVAFLAKNRDSGAKWPANDRAPVNGALGCVFAFKNNDLVVQCGRISFTPGLEESGTIECSLGKDATGSPVVNPINGKSLGIVIEELGDNLMRFLPHSHISGWFASNRVGGRYGNCS